MKDCLFCNIIAKKEPAYIIYEDEDVIAFLDKFPHPENPGHTLVVPKKHQELIYETDFDYNIINKVNKIARFLETKLHFDGLKIVNNNHTIAGQVIKHVHIHLIPYYQNLDDEVKSVENVFNTIKNNI